MSKKSDEMIFSAILMALIGLAAVAIVLMSRMGKAIYRWIQSYRNGSGMTINTATATRKATQRPSATSGDPWLDHCIEIEDAWNRGDYDWARQQLQRIAYSMVGRAQNDKERIEFTRLMTAFAKEDPLYKEVMERATPLIRANPGVLQSQLYKGQPDSIKEQMRYVLYFANELGHIKRIKKGNSYELFPPDQNDGGRREDGVVTYETLPKYSGEIGAAITMTFDEEAAELNREATRLKKAGDWNGAIDCLIKARDRSDSGDLRLPLYLQQAGRFDQSMQEFERILSGVDERYAKDFSHQPEFIQKGQALHAKATIYDKMRLACKREKRLEDEAKYEVLRDEFIYKFEQYRIVADQYQKNKLAEWHQQSA